MCLKNITIKPRMLARIAALGFYSVAGAGELPRITAFSVVKPDAGVVAGAGYVVDGSVAGEKRVYLDGHHFLSVLTTKGIFAVRPHPGMDVDGWGSTLYLQPFFESAVLKHTGSVAVNPATDYVMVEAEGFVSLGTNCTAGTWSASFKLTCSGKTVSAFGEYEIHLEKPLPSKAAGKDLNFYKLASNYLQDVPLLGGSNGDTGDMRFVHFGGETVLGVKEDWWHPVLNPAHFPNDVYTTLFVDCVGATNEVDSTRLGQGAIKLAHKPGLKVTLASRSGDGVCFGAFFDQTKARDFWEDNIGVTPVAPRGVLDTAADFYFDLAFESSAMPGDRLMDVVALEAEGDVARHWLGVLWSPSLAGKYTRIGSIATNAPGVFSGVLKPPAPGFFKVRGEESSNGAN